MFTIGVDPHKGSHVVAVLDHCEELLCEVRVRADRSQRDQLLAFAAPYAPRVWAVEGARGVGALLAQQLVVAGEHVVDVPAKLSARVRVLHNERSDKNDSHDARSAAIVALRNRKLCAVALEDHVAVLRMLAKRHHELTGLRTQAICRLHAVLATMIEGGLPRNLSADRAALELRRLRPTDAVGQARRQVAVEHLADVRRADRMLVELRPRIVAAVALSETTVTDVYGIGVVMAAYVLGYTGDIRRFASKDHYARYNATAPVSASSGPSPHHRLNLKSNRQINHAIHIAAVTQLAHDTPGRAFKLRAQPNDWHTQIAAAAKTSSEQAGKAPLYLAFWTRFLDRIHKEHPDWTHAQKPSTANWFSMPSPFKGGPYYAVSFAQGGKIRSELYIDYGDETDNMKLFDQLAAQKNTIGASYGVPLVWEDLPGKRACRIADYAQGDVVNGDEFDTYINWFFEKNARLRLALAEAASHLGT